MNIRDLRNLKAYEIGMQILDRDLGSLHFIAVWIARHTVGKTEERNRTQCQSRICHPLRALCGKLEVAESNIQCAKQQAPDIVDQDHDSDEELCKVKDEDHRAQYDLNGA